MEKQLKLFFEFLENDKKLSNNTLQSYKRDLKQFRRYIEGGELGEGHLFAYIPVVSAYNEQGEEWLNQVLEYIYSNVEFIDNYLQKNMPHIKAIRPQASFLIFLFAQ